jgi:hypothetical protein
MSGQGFGGGWGNPIGQLPTNMQSYIGGSGPMDQSDPAGMNASLPGAEVQDTAGAFQDTLQQDNYGGAAWPGFGYGGMPGRYQGGYGGSMGGMGNYGFGGGGFGYGGYSPWGYGPGSYSPWGAGSMGYGGGSGMYGGPMRPFSGFGGGFAPHQTWAQNAAGGPGFGGMYSPFSPSSIPFWQAPKPPTRPTPAAVNTGHGGGGPAR